LGRFNDTGNLFLSGSVSYKKFLRLAWIKAVLYKSGYLIACKKNATNVYKTIKKILNIGLMFYDQLVNN